MISKTLFKYYSIRAVQPLTLQHDDVGHAHRYPRIPVTPFQSNPLHFVAVSLIQTLRTNCVSKTNTLLSLHSDCPMGVLEMGN